MDYAITTDLTAGRNKVPSYTPFAIPQLDKEPRCDPSAGHRSSIARWRENSRHKNRSSAPISIPCQDWVLYNIRFLITGELCGAWRSFGGLAAQLPHVDIVLNIAKTENIPTALSYDRLVRTDIQERARARGERRIDAPSTEFVELLKNGNTKFKNLAIRGNTSTAPLRNPAHLSAPRRPRLRRGNLR